MDDIQLRSALLDMQGDFQRAAQRAKAIDLRYVKDPDLRKLVTTLRKESSDLAQRIASAR